MKSSSITTYSGIEFDYLNPTVDMVSIIDIAHATSMSCRFTGHIKEFRSVAQHMVDVSLILECAMNQPELFIQIPGSITADDIKQGLLHDASEAYIHDMARPLKNVVPQYVVVESQLEEVIFTKFNVSTTITPVVKWADNIALRSEAVSYLRNAEWADEPNVNWWPLTKSMTQTEAELAYLKRWIELL